MQSARFSMEYEEENGTLGRFPESGAIFMSNIATKRECFKRKLFGLPSAQANFVKHVKAGMALFLFEFERRELYGVFRASSDGSMNIVPHAFSSSGKQFPAQVRFTPLWDCRPLSEHEFRDAIKDNYFSAKKFNFGLSKDQVRRLLCLFSSRKLNSNLPQGQIFGQLTKLTGEDRRRVDDSRFLMNDKTEIESDVDNGCGPDISTEYAGSFLGRVRRVDDGRFPMSNRVENGCNVGNDLGRDIVTEYPGVSLVKTRRFNDGSFLAGAVRENKPKVNHALGQVNKSDYPGDSLGNVRRVSGNGQFLMSDRLENDHLLDNNLGPAMSTEYLGNSLDEARRISDDGQILKRDGVQIECNVGNDFRPVISTEPHGNPLGKVRRATDDGSSFLMHDRVENKCNVDSAFGSVISSGRFWNPSGKKRRTTDDGRFLTSDKVENECNVDNGCGMVISTEYLVHPLGKAKRAADDGIFAENDKVDNKCNMDNYFGPAISANYPDLCQTKQNPFVYSNKPIEEGCHSLGQDQLKHSSAYSRLTESQIFDFSYPASHDAIVTRAVPYDSEVTNIHYRSSSSSLFGVDHSFKLVEDFPPYYSSEGHLISSNKMQSSPYFLEPKGLNRCLDVASGYGDKVPLPATPIHQDCSCCRINNSFSSGEYSENGELESSSHKGPKSSLFSDPSLDSVALPRGEIYEREKMSPLSYAYRPSENSPLIFNNGYPVALQGKYEQKVPWHEIDGTFSAKDFHSSDENMCHMQSGAHSESRVIYCHEKSSINHDINYHRHSEGMQCDSQNKRTSVFARLTSASKVHLPKNDTFACHDEFDMDASMDMLRHSQNPQVKRMRKFKPLIGHDSDKISEIKEKHTTINSQLEYDRSMMMMKMKMDTILAAEGNGGKMAEATRLKDFKRRSERKKNEDESKKNVFGEVAVKTEGSLDHAEGEGFAGQHKRRKLIRPVFGKKESFDEGLDCGRAQNLQPSCQESSVCNDNTESCDDGSVKICENDRPSPKVGLIHVICPPGCEGDNINTEESSNCRDEINSKNCEAPSRCDGHDDGNETPQNVGIQNANFPVCSAETTLNVGIGSTVKNSVVSQEVGMINCRTNIPESSSVDEANAADSGDSRGKEVRLQDVEEGNETCAVSCETIMNKLKNRPSLQKLKLERASEEFVGVCCTNGW
ncbi:hypothetical protein F0562_029299 [Nyssa sinensis]|uniref:DCD domain-containing protein n=1 Tax=Nyssa sinensis TaxID=561372 RepID=A0A5J5B6M8_9ASTE|nr:hypothetical protein F0562_029299 [Nyssa sinensis]